MLNTDEPETVSQFHYMYSLAAGNNSGYMYSLAAEKARVYC